MVTLYRELIRMPQEAGALLRTPWQKATLEICFSPITNQTIAVDFGIKSRHTANAILESAGLPKAF